MRRTLVFITTGVVLGLIGPRSSLAQEPEPVFHVITVTTFSVPLGEASDRFGEHVDTYVIPPIKEDPHIVAFRLARHSWGTTDPNAWMITEYESMEAFAQSQEWQSNWFDEHYPEGSPEREAADQAGEENFLPYFTHHTDNILSASMNRAK